MDESPRRPPRVSAIPLPRLDADDLAEPLPEEVQPRRLRRAVAGLAAAVALVVVAIVLLPGIGDLRRSFAHASAAWIVIGVALELASSLAYVVAFRFVFCTRMDWSATYKIAMSELGVNSLLPVGGAGGLALGAWALRRAGMEAEEIAKKTVAFFLLTSVPNVTLLVVLGIGLAVGLLPGDVGLPLAIVPAAVAAAGIGGTLALGPITERRGMRDLPPDASGLRRKAVAAMRAIGAGVADAVALLRGRDPRLMLGVFGYLVFDVLVLWASFRAIGHSPELAVLAVAYLVGQLGNLVPLPGGIGGVELGLVGALVLYGQHAVTATAAVLLYRAVQLWVPAIIGGVALVQLRALLRSETRRIEVCSVGETVQILGRGPVVVGAPVARRAAS
jgi:uncharacterized membrane protein YbhN (UPF0104 family)